MSEEEFETFEDFFRDFLFRYSDEEVKDFVILIDDKDEKVVLISVFAIHEMDDEYLLSIRGMRFDESEIIDFTIVLPEEGIREIYEMLRRWMNSRKGGSSD